MIGLEPMPFHDVVYHLTYIYNLVIVFHLFHLMFAEFDSIHPIDVAGISRDCLFCSYASGYYQLTRSTINLFHANPLRLDQ